MKKLEEVIEGCKRGDKLSQKELYDRYSSRYFVFCRRYAADDESAKDILIDGFLAVFQSVDTYSGNGSFEGWMKTIFLRKAIGYYRRDLKHRQNTESLEEVSQDIDSGANVEVQIDIRDALIEALRTLTDDERAVFNLVAIDGYLLVEAAAEVGIPESTAKSRYYRALETVKGLVTKRLGTEFIKRYK